MRATNLLRLADALPRGPIVAIGIAAGFAFCLGAYVGMQPSTGTEVLPVQEGMGEMSQEEMMEMYDQAGQPDQHHEALKVFVGTWDADLKTMMEGWEEFNTTGTATYEMTMGGRFLAMDFKSTVMGEPMNGMNLTGYHKAKERYESIWVDDSSTALNYMTGQKTDDGWVYEGEETDPVAGQTLPVRDVIVMQGDDKFTFTRHYPAEAAGMMGIPVEEGAKWAPGFEIVYTRAKGDAAGGGAGNAAGTLNRR